MRSFARAVLTVLALLCASAALADEPEPKDKHPRLIKPEGPGADNAQLGGEPWLTETKVDDAKNADEGAEPSEDECDLDCLEAEFVKEEEKEQERTSTVELAKEKGAVTVQARDDAGDVLSAEPSTTRASDAGPDTAKQSVRLGRLGPVRIRIGETDDWIGIGFAMQMEFDYAQQYAGSGATKANSETLEFRRIRATLSSSFIEGRIRTGFQINMTPSSFELIDMWLAFTRLKFATMRIGQFKIPYDRYRAQSFAALSFIDWAPTTRMFGSERQIGVEMLAKGGFLNLEYAGGIFSGVNARASHAVGITEVYGLVPENPSSFGDGSVVREFHPALVGRVAKNFGAINTDTNSDVTGEKELRHSVGAGVAWDARPTPTQDLGLRLSAEWLGKIRHVHMNVVSYVAWYAPWQGGKILFGPIGFMGEVGYRFTPMWEMAIRYSSTYLTPWLRSDARSFGEDQIANASDPTAAQEQFGQNGNQITNDELALAGTSHIFGNSLKLVAQAAWESQLWVQGRRNGLALNLQLQFLF